MVSVCLTTTLYTHGSYAPATTITIPHICSIHPPSLSQRVVTQYNNGVGHYYILLIILKHNLLYLVSGVVLLTCAIYLYFFLLLFWYTTVNMKQITDKGYHKEVHKDVQLANRYVTEHDTNHV